MKIISLFQRLKVYEVLKKGDRISSLDIFRAFAIIGVVLYHFHHFFSYGFLGVDLFFVISGLLVGGILTKEFYKDQRINIPRFYLQRGFKIWPSFYFFLIAGTLMAILFYRNSHPEQIIPLKEMFRYALFYQNYAENPPHYSFDHVWSLCVEEHFYLTLPILFFIIHRFVKKENRTRSLYALVIFSIMAGNVFKVISYYSPGGINIYATHNRIDALAWGVLLNLIILHYGEKLKQYRYLFLLTIIGILLFISAVLFDKHTSSDIYHNIIFRSILPPSFFLMILGVYYQNFNRLYPLRIIGYYSYNWYLWHVLFIPIVSDKVSVGRLGLAVSLTLSFTMCVIASVLVEEPFLELRKKVIPRLFRKDRVPAAT